MATKSCRNRTPCLARLARIQPWYVMIRYPNRLTHSIFAFINAGIAISIMILLADYTHQPLLFPSLGPSAFLFFSQPSAAASAPRNAILGHTIGVFIGWTCFRLFDIETTTGGIAATALSMSLTSAAMIATRYVHPPAASTTLMVSLGMIQGGVEMIALVIGVVLLTAQAFAINRLSGISYPVWSPRTVNSADTFVATALETNELSTPNDPYASVAEQLVRRKRVT